MCPTTLKKFVAICARDPENHVPLVYALGRNGGVFCAIRSTYAQLIWTQPNRQPHFFSILGLSELDDLERACPKGIGSGMIKPAEIDPTVLAQSVLGLLMRSGRRRADGLGRTMKVEQDSGETMVFSMLADKAFDAAHVARVRIWLADRLVLDVELDCDGDNHVVRAFDDAEW